MPAVDILLANTNATPLVNAGSVTFNYPTGRQAGDYIRGTEVLSVPGRQGIFQPSGNFSVVYGATSATLTWSNASVSIPALNLLRLQVNVYSTQQPASPYNEPVATPILHPGYLAGKTYTMLDAGAVSNAAPGAIDTVYLYPFRVFAPITFTAGAIRASAGGAGSSVKSGIWMNSPVSGRPVGKALFADNTGAATTGTGQIAIALAGSLDPGFYWFGTKFTGTLPTVQSAVTPTALVPNGGAGSTVGVSASDTYSNDISALNFAEGFASFTAVGSVPVLQLTT